MNKDTQSDITTAAKELGSLGGRSGRGSAKARSPKHYKLMAQIRAKNGQKRNKKKP